MLSKLSRLCALGGAAALAVGVAGSSAQAADPIKIGIIGPNTGPYAIIGEEIQFGLGLYFSEQGGEAGGRKIELIFEDAQAKPDVGLTKVQKLVERDQVDFLAGVVSSSVAYAIRDYVVDKKVPLIVTVASADGLTQKLAAPNIFRTNTSGSQNSHPFGTWLYDQGYRSLIIMAPDYAMGYEQTGGFARTFEAAGGKIVKTIYSPLGTPDFAPFLTSFSPSDADAVGAVFAGGEAIKFVKQYDEYGLKGQVPLVGTGLLTDDLILQQEGDAALGIVSSTHYTSVLDNPENKAFVAAYQAKHKRPPTVYAESSYVAGRVIAEAIKAVGGDLSDGEAVLAAIGKADFAAPRGHFRFGEYHSPIHTVYATKVEKRDGRYVNVPIAEFENISQFYTWTPKDYLAMPAYSEIANDWVK